MCAAQLCLRPSGGKAEIESTAHGDVAMQQYGAQLIDRRTDGAPRSNARNEHGSAHLHGVGCTVAEASAAHRIQPSRDDSFNRGKSAWRTISTCLARPRHFDRRPAAKDAAANVMMIQRPALTRGSGRMVRCNKIRGDATPTGPTPATKMLIAKNSVEPAVFVLFFYNFSTIPGAADAGSRLFVRRTLSQRCGTAFGTESRRSRCCAPFESAIPGRSLGDSVPRRDRSVIDTSPAVGRHRPCRQLQPSPAPDRARAPGSEWIPRFEGVLASARAFGTRMNHIATRGCGLHPHAGDACPPTGGQEMRDGDSSCLPPPRALRSRPDSRPSGPVGVAR